ncbi:MAG TPA: hypothetical protein VEV45_21070 [Streptosporangiaceae bacterium]|nr:hypothetical protein [Streptosporangiaceae bacterium]
MAGLGGASPIEQKAVAGPTTALIAGYLSTILISAVPWLHDHLTPDQQQSLPIIIAFLLSAAAAYLAPHTHRPDLVAVQPGRHVENVALPPDQPHV